MKLIDIREDGEIAFLIDRYPHDACMDGCIIREQISSSNPPGVFSVLGPHHTTFTTLAYVLLFSRQRIEFKIHIERNDPQQSAQANCFVKFLVRIQLLV
jgi:hypothetical protein